MKISEIRPNQGSINIEAVVVEMEPARDIRTQYGKSLKVANAFIQDDSGKVKLTLWNDEIGKVKVGDKIKLTNGFSKAYKDEIQVTIGKFGKLEVTGQGEAPKIKDVPEGKVEVESEDLYEDEEEW